METDSDFKLIELRLADSPVAWTAAGFKVVSCKGLDQIQIGHVKLYFGGTGTNGGITGWTFQSSTTIAEKEFDIDGIPTRLVKNADGQCLDSAPHPNGVTGIDHVVVLSTDALGIVSKLQTLGIPLRKVGEARNKMKVWFFKAGRVVIELGQVPATFLDGVSGYERTRTRSGMIWGITFECNDLNKVVNIGLLKNSPKAAVQGPSRFICTLDSVKAGISTNVAFITPSIRATASSESKNKL